MTLQDLILLAAFFALVLIPAPLLGKFIYKAMEGQRTWLQPILEPVEHCIYRSAGIKPSQSWKHYAVAVPRFSALRLLVLFALLIGQGLLGVEWTLALNTAASFVGNTNGQAYSGEATLSYLSQMGGLTVQNFVSPA